MAASGVGVVPKTGTAAMEIALGIMVGNQHESASSLCDRTPYLSCQYFCKIWPTQTEAAPEIAERQDDAGRSLSGHRDVDASVHAVQRHDSSRVLCDIEAARKLGF